MNPILKVEAREGTVFLEWRSEGRVGDQSFQYDGVSVIEFGEDGITAFRAYFDPRQLSIRPGSSERKSEDSKLVGAQRQAGEKRPGGYSKRPKTCPAKRCARERPL